MSVYIVYKLIIGMLEVCCIVIFNIYSGGILLVEVGVYIVELIYNMFEKKCFGIDLK